MSKGLHPGSCSCPQPCSETVAPSVCRPLFHWHLWCKSNDWISQLGSIFYSIHLRVGPVPELCHLPYCGVRESHRLRSSEFSLFYFFPLTQPPATTIPPSVSLRVAPPGTSYKQNPTVFVLSCSLSILSSRSIPVVAVLRISFLFKAK